MTELKKDKDNTDCLKNPSEYINPNCSNCTIDHIDNNVTDGICRIYNPENWNGLCAYQN